MYFLVVEGEELFGLVVDVVEVFCSGRWCWRGIYGCGFCFSGLGGLVLSCSPLLLRISAIMPPF